jgi:hypothetical protein
MGPVSQVMISEAIHYYNDLLAERHLESTVEMLASTKSRLSVGERPVCNVLRPYFIDSDVYSHVKKTSTLLMRGITTLCRHLIEQPELRRNMDLSPMEEAIIHVNTGYGLPDVSARLDGFLSADNHFAFVEYNADSPGGIGYGDLLGEQFANTPLMQDFSRRYSFQLMPVRMFVFESLLHAYHEWGGTGLPAIAIVDWKESATYPEFLLFQEFFEKHGCRVKIGDPRELEYRNGHLSLGDFNIDLVYKRLVVGEMLDRMGVKNPLVDAARDRAVCVANGFGVQLAFRKNLFALLTDPDHSHLFEPDVLRLIQKHVPWTRRVQEGKTTYRNKDVDLPSFILHNRESLVLKPGGDYGGRGVVLGWESTPEQWESHLNQALKNSYVVQERVSIGSEVFPSLDQGKLVFNERFFDLDPYVWNAERVEGCGVRLSRVSLLNVSAGGGSAAPLFILSARDA